MSTDAVAKTEAPTGAVGRPSGYSEEVASEILLRLADGESLVAICATEGMPGYTTVRRWLARNEEFRLNYALAREDQAEWYADRIADRARQEPATIEGRVDPGEVQHRRLEIDTLKWIASKLLPKKYGDSMAVQHEITVNREPIDKLRERVLTAAPKHLRE